MRPSLKMISETKTKRETIKRENTNTTNTTNIKYDIEKLHSITDIQAYIRFPTHNFVYNKLDLIQKQNIPCAPSGVYPSPTHYPIVMKPIINLFGMSRDTIKIEKDDAYTKQIHNPNHPSSPSNFWMPFIEGNHYTIDLLIYQGDILFMNTFQSFSHEQKGMTIGIFREHQYRKHFSLPQICVDFLRSILGDYIGCVNIEIIGDVILEMHLRWNGDNFMYRENPSLFPFLNEKIRERQESIQPKPPKSYTFSFRDKVYEYVPLFIYRPSDISILKKCIRRYKREIERETEGGGEGEKEDMRKFSIHYDDLTSIKQQTIKRYCVIVFTDEKEKNKFIKYIYK